MSADMVASAAGPSRKLSGQRRQIAAALGVICIGVVAVALVVGNATLKPSEHRTMLMPSSAAPQRTTELWFGPGISDDLNRMIRMGVAPSHSSVTLAPT